MISPPILAGAPSGGGPAPYHASAVHFDAATWLTSTDALSAVPGPLGIFSVWCFQVTQGDLSAAGNGEFLNTPALVAIVSAGGGSAPSAYTGVGLQLLEDGTFTNLLNTDTADDVIPAGTWTHVLCSWNTNFATPNKRAACYINDVLMPWSQVDQDTGGAFNIGYNDSHYVVGTYIGGGSPASPAILGDLADLNFITTATIVEADNTISEANRRKFISAGGKPVDPGTTGFTSLVLLSGDAATFASNLAGTGAFTPTGTLTNASTSPSD